MSIKEYIHWLNNASIGFRFRILLSGIIGILYVSASLAFVWVSKTLIDIATLQSSSNLILFISLILSCILAQLLFSFLDSRIEVRTEIAIRSSLRYRLFTRLMESRWMGKESLHTGDILNRLEGDVLSVTDVLTRVIPSVFVTLIQLIGALVFLCKLDMRLAAVLVFVMPAALFLSKRYMFTMRKLTKEIRTTDSRVQSHLQETIQHRTLISTLEYTSHVNNTLADLQTSLQQQVMRRNDFSLFSRTMVRAGFAVGYVIAFLWGVFGLRDGAVTFGIMTAFLQLVAQIQRPMVELSRQIPTIVNSTTSCDRLAELSSLPVEEKGESIKLAGQLGIRLENINFSYPDSAINVINQFTYNFEPGSLTAVIGETGVGKSTLIRIMLALLLPTKGKIELYNKEQTINVSPLTRCNMVYIPQGNTLISGTIRENLLLGNPNATDVDLQKVLHIAVADFVYSLPNGLDTVCGELGTGLSEGQAQRIAIARGLLRPGGILLFDEPTSSLDNETERILLERLGELVKDKTLILITHRETIAKLCTNSLVIK